LSQSQPFFLLQLAPQAANRILAIIVGNALLTVKSTICSITNLHYTAIAQLATMANSVKASVTECLLW